MSLINFSVKNLWPFLITIFLLILLAPIFFVLISLFGEYNENWSHLYNYVLSKYLLNSFFLILGVSILSIILGVGSAWLITNYDFVNKAWLEWAVILPLAVPPYILAYTFTGLFDSYGTANEIIRIIFDTKDNYIFFPNVRNIYGAIIVFSFTLYPYIYLTTRMAFLNQSRSLMEAGTLLGLNSWSLFYKLAIPLIRPALIAGLALVIMETISDFGAVEHFAVQTFTTGIFRTWFGMYDLNTAMQLSSLLLIFIAFFVVLERTERNKMSYTYSNSTFRKTDSKKLKGLKSICAFLFCFAPLFVGFILPIIELTNWAIFFPSENFFSENVIYSFFNTIWLGISAGIICTMFALFINFLKRFDEDFFLNSSSQLLALGYALPGLVLAVGIIQFFSFLDDYFIRYFLKISLVGSLIGLIIAYTIKAYALANNTIESGFKRISSSIDDASLSLKGSKFSIFYRIHMPLLKTSILTSLLLVISEVIKELPATLILRPFNFDTLAVSTYIYASEERMYEAASPAMLIVLVGLIPIFFLSRIIRDSRPGNL
jgi:iron(III) transport system permease protein